MHYHASCAPCAHKPRFDDSLPVVIRVTASCVDAFVHARFGCRQTCNQHLCCFMQPHSLCCGNFACKAYANQDTLLLDFIIDRSPLQTCLAPCDHQLYRGLRPNKHQSLMLQKALQARIYLAPDVGLLSPTLFTRSSFSEPCRISEGSKAFGIRRLSHKVLN